MHRERAIGPMTTTKLIALPISRIVYQWLTTLENWLVPGLSLLLKSDYCKANQRASSKTPSLQSTSTIEMELVEIIA